MRVVAYVWKEVARSGNLIFPIFEQSVASLSPLKSEALMRRKFIRLLAVLCIIGLTTTAAFAAKPSFKIDTSFSLTSTSTSTSGTLAASSAFSSQTFSAGEVVVTAPLLRAEGVLGGLGRTDVIVNMVAKGTPEVSCINQGGTMAPGQNPAKFSALGSDFVDRSTITKNGTAPFDVTASPASTTPKDMGCASNSWSALVTFVYWSSATISVSATDGTPLLKQDFTCVTTKSPLSVSCTPVP